MDKKNIATRMQQEFDMEVPLHEVFVARTVAEIALVFMSTAVSALDFTIPITMGG